MKYFTIQELCKSKTATDLGIDNTPKKNHEANMKLLIENLLDPIREMWGNKIYVNSGYRCKDLNNAVGGVDTSHHCFDEQTEILTVDGWRKYNEIKKGDDIFTYSLTDDCIEIKPINSIIKYHHQGRMMCLENAHIDVCVTDEHRMLVKYDTHKYKRKGNRNISEKGQEYFDSLKTNNDIFHIERAKDVYGRRRFFMCASMLKSNEIYPNIDYLKLVVAIIADGTFTYNNGLMNGANFHLKKQRKINHIEELLQKLDYSYTTRIDKEGCTNIWIKGSLLREAFNMIGRRKEIPCWFKTLSPNIQKELLFEYSFYDGHHDNRHGCNSFMISTTNKHNFDELQAMCTLSGMRFSVNFRPKREYSIMGKVGIAKESYSINIHKHRNTTKVSELNYKWIDYDGIVWCANNENTTVIVRRNGKVSIQGNCYGMAADISVRSVSGNKELFEMIKNSDLEWTQLISEKTTNKGCKWIHISYCENNLKKQVLVYR